MAWPRRPPEGTRCDAHIGVRFDQFGAPVVDRCPNPAVETCIDPLGLENWLCGTCAGSLAAKGHVRRNPKRKD